MRVQLPARLRPALLRPRARTVAAALAAAFLAVAPAAVAHPALTPASVNVGDRARIAVQIPNERAGHATVGLTLSFAEGFTVDAAESTGDWRATVDGRRVTWSGGTIDGTDAVDFGLELTAVAPTRTYDVALDQRYDDGRSVRTTAQITVLPALGGEATPSQHLGRAIAAAVAGVVVVVGSLLAVHLLRRRSAAEPAERQPPTGPARRGSPRP